MPEARDIQTSNTHAYLTMFAKAQAKKQLQTLSGRHTNFGVLVMWEG